MKKDKINFLLLNTFIGKGLLGNPTPVFMLDEPVSNERMQSIARNLMMPVTVFLIEGDSSTDFELRFFTNTGEIATCGHGALGAAFAISRLKNFNQPIRFKTADSSLLTCSQDKGITFIHYPKLQAEKIGMIEAVNKALGINEFKDYFFSHELESLFIELQNEEALDLIIPDFQRLLNSTNSIKEVVIMSESSREGFDINLRSFCPWIGIDEDPVTGSIHSVLGEYWKKRLGKSVIRVHQSSERGGQLIVQPEGGFVKIGGECEILIEGTLQH